jgi:hypothetical protein
MTKHTNEFTFEDAVEMWLLWWSGEKKHRIAAKFDVNVWRVYDVCKYQTLYPGSRNVAAQRLAASVPA